MSKKIAVVTGYAGFIGCTFVRKLLEAGYYVHCVDKFSYYSDLLPGNQAVEKYQRAIKLEPDFADAHYNLANAFHEVGELEKAAYSFKISLKINPDDAEVLSNLGKEYSL